MKDDRLDVLPSLHGLQLRLLLVMLRMESEIYPHDCLSQADVFRCYSVYCEGKHITPPAPGVVTGYLETLKTYSLIRVVNQNKKTPMYVLNVTVDMMLQMKLSAAVHGNLYDELMAIPTR